MSSFRLPVHRALDKFLDADLVDVVVIGVTEDDEIVIASSGTAEESIDLVERGSAEIEILAGTED
jgi:hypothetical protein